MLHRAASNAYSWWWASHIRTKQSKWLDNNLQEMDEKVQYMLKLIDEDGDSFARRAESYYRKRPELISFVEEFYRAYRALAERYDHISGELQNANHTIATVFPEQVQFAMDEEDDSGSPKMSARQVNTSKIPKDLPEAPKITIPNFLRSLNKEKSSPAKPPKRQQSKKTSTATATNSHLSKCEAIEEIDKLQKGILALQTEKEFVKSSYENRLSKYWEIEKAITDMQEKVCGLQDEFNVGTLIEDHEARTLMASTALKSCQETLVQLQEKQEKSSEEARREYERIKDAREKLVALKGKFLQDQKDQIPTEGPTLEILEQEVHNVQEEILDAESVREKIREHFEVNSGGNLTVPEMAEKIDELVTKVISLETAVSSQTALINRLRSETDGLRENLRSLEDGKLVLVQDPNKLNEKLRELEGEFNAVQELNRSVKNQNNNLQTHFTEAHCNLDHLSEKLKSVKPLDEENEMTGSSKEEIDVLINVEQHKEDKAPKEKIISSEDTINRKEKSDVPVNVESRKGHEEPEENIILTEDRRSEKEEATGIDEVQLAQDPSVHVSDEADASTMHFNEKEEAPSLGVSDQAEAPALHFNENEEAPSLGVSDQAEAPALHFNENEEAPFLGVSDQAEAPALNFNEKEEAPSLRASDQAGAPTLNIHEKEGAPSLHVSDTAEAPTLNAHEKEGAPSLHVSGQADAHSVHFRDQAEPDSSSNEADVFEMKVELLQRDDVEKQDEKVLDSEKFIEEGKDEPNWKELYLAGLEDRERILLAEYTSILRKYKETRKQLSELQIENHDRQFEAMVQLRELKSAIIIKDEEIKSLRQKLKFLQESDNSQLEKANSQEAGDLLEEGFSFQTCSTTTVNFEHLQASNLQDRNAEERASSVSSTVDKASDIIPTKGEDEDEVKMVPIEEHHTVSALEEKFRRDIDELLEQNLEFWLRFSDGFHQIQVFQTSIEDLQGEYMKLKENQNQEESMSSKHGSSLQSDARPIYKHLREIQTDLTVWLEKNMLLKDELKYRLASLRSIYEEITRCSKTSSEPEVTVFTSYQAAKFQGEVLNMQQENNKVADELQAGLEHVKGLQIEIDKTLLQMNEELKLSGSKNHHHHVIHSLSRTRIPLRSFLFGAKKRQKPSFFACINPALQKQYSDLQGHVPR